MERLNRKRGNSRQWNRIKSSGILVAWGICAGAALVQPSEARPQGGSAGQPPMAGLNHDGPNHDYSRQDGRPPMRPEERINEELELTAAQQSKVQAIFDREREQMRAIHEQTQAAIAALLTPAQKARFDQMPQPGNGPRGGHPSGPDDGNREGQQHDGEGPRGGGWEMRGEMEDEDHGRPVELIAKDLGVTPEAFREAFKRVHPAPRGERPTEAQLRNNHEILAAALGVSIQKLDAVMDKYRPEGPDGPPRH